MKLSHKKHLIRKKTIRILGKRILHWMIRIEKRQCFNFK